MTPQLTGFALGLLLGAAKVMGIAAAGFGIAWWRARLQMKTLKTEVAELEAELEAVTKSFPAPLDRSQ